MENQNATPTGRREARRKFAAAVDHKLAAALERPPQAHQTTAVWEEIEVVGDCAGAEAGRTFRQWRMVPGTFRRLLQGQGL